MLEEKANAQASTLSGGQQKMLEVARGLLLDPKLILIDEPSIGLSPLMVQEVFAILKDLRDKGVTILLIEQNAKQALQISDYGLVEQARHAWWRISRRPTNCATAGGGLTAERVV
jgi:branched-chain amino acid transport system ATP-binding protein